jgi:L-rhamnose mutarotase
MDFDKAELRANDVITGVTRIIKDETKGSFRDQIIHMNSYSQPYEKLTEILDYIHELPSSEKTVYKDELKSVLYAFMEAHNLIQIPEIDDDKDFKDFPEFCLDREWIKKMSDQMKEHYYQTIEKREIHK